MPRGDRSRSPDAAERISRAVAGFGRYPKNRQAIGLKSDVNGALRLEDIMTTWGEKQGFTEKEVLHALRRHMFHDDEPDQRGQGALRFAIDSDAFGSIIIKVLPKKRKPVLEEEGLGRGPEQRPAPCATPARTKWPERGRRVVAQAPRPRQVRGSVLQDIERAAAAAADKEQEAPGQRRGQPEQFFIGDDEAPPPSLDADVKLDMPLDEVIRREGRAATPGRAGWTPPPLPRAEASSGSSGFKEKEARLRHRMEQMGHTVDTMHKRSGGKDGAPREVSEKVSRWISWVLQAGHKSLDVAIEEGGWAPLVAVAAAMRTHRPNLGEFDETKLREHLERTDQAGRFEMDGGRIRKVPKGARRPRGEGAKAEADGGISRRPEPGALRAASSGASSSRSARRRGSMSRSPSPAPANTGEDEALAEVCQSSLKVSGDITVTEATEAEAAQLEAAAEGRPKAAKESAAAEEPGQPPRPPPPPGEGWTKYQDNGANWWYYEGPLGQFWCQENSKDILPYGETADVVLEEAAGP